MRAFVALEVPEVVRRAVGREVAALRPRLPAAKWVEEDSYHVTLVFLGEIDTAASEELAARLAPVVGCHESFRARLGRAGSFPPRRPARVLWVGVEAPDGLGLLQQDVAAVCGEVTNRTEKRPFHAHVTVARCRRPWPRSAVGRWTNGLPESVGETFLLDRAVLMRSRLGASGARYEEIRAFALAGK